MPLASKILTALIALEHAYFCVLEMFLYQRPHGLETFGVDPDFAARTAVMMANQGLYNAFLAAGLAWSLFAREPIAVRRFFLGCVAIAGAYGGYTLGFATFLVQGVPALIALALTTSPKPRAVRAPQAPPL